MSQSIEVSKCSDDMIRHLGTTESGFENYAIGNKVTVSYRGNARWLCRTCKYPENYQNADHKGCCHIERLARYRNEHLEELNYAKADPSILPGGVVE